MNQKIITIYFCLLFIIISLINSKIFNIFWVDFWFYVKWNFEFTKAIFFNIFSSIFIIIYFLLNFKKKIIIPKIFYYIFLVIIISLFTTSFFYTNIFWNEVKWHWLIFFINLIWLFLILLNQDNKTKKNILKYIIYLSILPVILAIKEYYNPSFVYEDLKNRAFGTFWHPNLLASFILLLTPIVLYKIKNNFIFLIFVIFTFTIFLTKSIIPIAIYISYILWYFYKNYNINKKNILYIWIIFLLWLSYIIYNFWIITKLNSFVSRFFIWETTLKIIFSDIKYILFWIWNDSLQYIFDGFKSPYLYIFENIWYTADRPHNYFLQIFINNWIWWLLITFFIIFNYIKNYENNAYFHSILLYIIFLIFNFPSIIHYIILIIIIAIIYIKNNKQKLDYYGFKIIFILISIFSIISSFLYYREENRTFINKKYNSNVITYIKLKNENIENYIIKHQKNYKNICYLLTKKIDSVENNIFCWNILWNIDKNLAIYYYKKWLSKLPDMRNNYSTYKSNIFVKKLYNKNRFFSDKYSNIKIILERLEKHSFLDL